MHAFTQECGFEAHLLMRCCEIVTPLVYHIPMIHMPQIGFESGTIGAAHRKSTPEVISLSAKYRGAMQR